MLAWERGSATLRPSVLSGLALVLPPGPSTSHTPKLLRKYGDELHLTFCRNVTRRNGMRQGEASVSRAAAACARSSLRQRSTAGGDASFEPLWTEAVRTVVEVGLRGGLVWPEMLDGREP